MPHVQDPRLADHAVGLELQLAELVEQRQRATVQHRDGDAADLQRAIDAVQADLAQTAERLAGDAEPVEVHGAVTAESA